MTDRIALSRQSSLLFLPPSSNARGTPSVVRGYTTLQPSVIKNLPCSTMDDVAQALDLISPASELTPLPIPIKITQAMARAAKEKTDFPIAPQNDTARGSWHTATAGMYTKEGLAELRSSQAFTPKPSGGRSRERMTRGGVGGGDEEAGAAAGERVFAGDEAEMVHEAGQQGDLKEVRVWCGGE